MRWIGMVDRLRVPWRLMALLLGLGACADPTGEGGAGFAAVSLRATLPAAVASGLFDLAVDHVRIYVIRAPASAVLDTMIYFPPDQSQLSVQVRVPLNLPREELSVSLELRASTRILFAGTESVVFTADNPATLTIPLQYVGPGTEMTSVFITPRDTALKPGDTFTYGVRALAGRAILDSFYVGWSTSDPQLAKVDARGVLRAPDRTGSTMLRVVSPTGIRDSTRVWFSAPASKLVITGGDGQIGAVGQAVAEKLEVRALTVDEKGAPGVRVRFTSPTGGRVIDSLNTTDGDGFVRATAILGPVAGTQIFYATAPNLPTVTFLLEAHPGEPTTIVATAGNGQTGRVGQTLSPFVVTVQDRYRNTVPLAEVFWTVVQGAGTLSALNTVTDARGNAQVTYILGSVVGLQTVAARLFTGLTVTFTVTATP